MLWENKAIEHISGLNTIQYIHHIHNIADKHSNIYFTSINLMKEN